MSGQTLRTPTVRLNAGNIEIRLRGVGHIIACVDSHRLIAGPLHNETVVHFKSPDAWSWVRMNLGRYVGHGVHFEFVPDESNSLPVSLVTQNISNEKRVAVEQQEKIRLDASIKLQQWLDNFISDAEANQAEASAKAAAAIKDLISQWSSARSNLRKSIRLELPLAMAKTAPRFMTCMPRCCTCWVSITRDQHFDSVAATCA